MRKKIFVFLGVVMSVFIGMSALNPNLAYAEGEGGSYFAPGDGCTSAFLGFRPWYQGLPKGDKCTIGEVSEDGLPAFVWTIVLNVLADLFGVIGYLSIIFVIYGGFLFIMAHGDPGKIAKGKKTLTAAIIGVGIALLASVIVNTITTVLSGAIQ